MARPIPPPFPLEFVWECPPEQRRAFIYEVFRDDGRHLYIGCTRRIWWRFDEHRLKSPMWYPTAHHAVVTVLSSWSEAHRREQAMIEKIRPLHNSTRSDGGRRGWETRRGLKPAAHVERGQTWGDAPLCALTVPRSLPAGRGQTAALTPTEEQ